MSIIEVREWIEVNKKIITLGVLFFLISSISFALGYLSAGELKHPQIVIEKNEAQVPATASVIEQVKQVVKKEPVVSKPTPVPKPIVIPATQATPVPVVVSVAPVVSTPTPIPAPTPAPEVTTAPVEPAPAVEPPPPVPVPVAPIQITEVTAGTEVSSDDEFIELYNPNSVAIDLSDYSIKKKTSSGSESTLVSSARLQGKSIPAGKHFLISHDEGYAGSVTPDATWAKSNSLAYTNNAVILYSATGAKVSEVSWTEIEKGRSSAGVPTPQNSGQ